MAKKAKLETGEDEVTESLKGTMNMESRPEISDVKYKDEKDGTEGSKDKEGSESKVGCEDKERSNGKVGEEESEGEDVEGEEDRMMGGARVGGVGRGGRGAPTLGRSAARPRTHSRGHWWRRESLAQCPPGWMESTGYHAWRLHLLDDVGEGLPLGLPVEAVPQEHPVPPLLLARDVPGHAKHHRLTGVPHNFQQFRLALVRGAGVSFLLSVGRHLDLRILQSPSTFEAWFH